MDVNAKILKTVSKSNPTMHESFIYYSEVRFIPDVQACLKIRKSMCSPYQQMIDENLYIS